MERREFLRTGCIACIGMAIGASALQGCVTGKYAQGRLNENGMLVELSEFQTAKKEARPYVVVRHDDLAFPICIYRLDEGKYSALLMRCTHQGAELQVSGDQLTCPAHGSEFDKMGNVTQSPAASPLRSFPVTVTGGQLFIDLRKQS